MLRLFNLKFLGKPCKQISLLNFLPFLECISKWKMHTLYLAKEFLMKVFRSHGNPYKWNKIDEWEESQRKFASEVLIEELQISLQWRILVIFLLFLDNRLKNIIYNVIPYFKCIFATFCCKLNVFITRINNKNFHKCLSQNSRFFCVGH